MKLTTTEKIDVLNIGLMIFAAAVALVLPFHLFLFVYAILGPLHYLTEISWLHDKNYYTKGKNDAVFLLLVGVLLTLAYFKRDIELELPPDIDANLVYIAILASLIFVTVKTPLYRIGGIIVLILSSQVAHNYKYLFTVFVPTLIHVYVFTALFMLYGTIKSKSRVGYLAFAVMLLCPVFLYNFFPDRAFYPANDYSKEAYHLFTGVNMIFLKDIMHVPNPGTREGWTNMIYHSSDGILLMRFIAFAYTYHYLNWFSKTKIIQWHAVPRSRFALVIIVWLASIGLYMYNYQVGMQWLIFLSFMHVLLELPLNCISIIGIGKHIGSKVFRPAKAT